MRLVSDIMIFFGAILLTLGTDLVVETAGQQLASVGSLLGTLVSVIGVSILTGGLLSHARLSREGSDQEAVARTMKTDGRR
jgi:hypothetical protein